VAVTRSPVYTEACPAVVGQCHCGRGRRKIVVTGAVLMKARACVLWTSDISKRTVAVRPRGMLEADSSAAI